MATGSPFYITIPQLAELQARFAAFPENYKAILAKTLEKAAISVQATMMSQVPVKTGRLRQSIGYIVKGSEAIVSVNPKLAPYAEFLETGTGTFGVHGTNVTSPKGVVMVTKINPGWGSANAGGYFVIGMWQKGLEANPFMVRTRMLGWPIVQLTFAEGAKLLTSSLAD